MIFASKVCPECAATDIDYKLRTEKFKYGPDGDPSQVELEAQVEKGFCNSCHFMWLDSRQEAAFTDAVCKHLQKENKELKEKLKAFQEASRA